MPDVLDNTVSIKIKEDEFIFRVPSPLDSAKIGIVAASLRRKLDPDSAGFEDGLDWGTAYLIRCMATMVVTLEKASVDWAFTNATDKATGKVTSYVDPETFPPQATAILVDLYVKLQEAVARFLGIWTGDDQPTGAEAVASVTNTPVQSV